MIQLNESTQPQPQSLGVPGLGSVPIEPRPIESDLSVMVPTLGRPLLESCLGSVVRGSLWPGRLIVIDQGDNSSVSHWLAILDRSGLPTLHVRAPRRGVAAARNRGIECLETRFVAITDDDCTVDDHWLTNLASHLEQNPTEIVTGPVLPGGDDYIPSTITSRTDRQYSRPPLHRDVLYAGNMGSVADVFEQVGEFDESPYLRFAEDNDWSYRALRSGITIRYAPDVEVTHLDWRDDLSLIATYRNYARSQGAFFGKHLGAGDGLMLLRILIALARASRRTLIGLLSANDLATANGRATLTQLIPGILEGLTKCR